MIYTDSCLISFLLNSHEKERKFEIDAVTYNRYLQQEMQLNKYKLICEKKAKEIKRLQDQVAYYKRQANIPKTDIVPINEDTEHVNKKILI